MFIKPKPKPHICKNAPKLKDKRVLGPSWKHRSVESYSMPVLLFSCFTYELASHRQLLPKPCGIVIHHTTLPCFSYPVEILASVIMVQFLPHQRVIVHKHLGDIKNRTLVCEVNKKIVNVGRRPERLGRFWSITSASYLTNTKIGWETKRFMKHIIFFI